MENTSRQAIVDALLKLLENKPLSAISISELAREAKVSRMTIYRNYCSKEDIFAVHLRDVLSQYKQDTGKRYGVGSYCDKENIVHCFSYFSKHKKFLEGALKSGYGHIFLQEVDQYVMDTWWKDGEGRKKEYRLHAFSGALYNLYISWALNGYVETPEQMADILEKMRFGDPSGEDIRQKTE